MQSRRNHRNTGSRRARLALAIAALWAATFPHWAAGADPAAPAGEPPALPPATASAMLPSDKSIGGADPLLKLGPGDAVAVQVYGRPELSITTYVADDGSITVPLAGSVPVGGVSPATAAQRVAAAYEKGQFLRDPQVTVTLHSFRSQQVSVLGEVEGPGRFPIESRTTVLDLIAQAGGITETGAQSAWLLRPRADGSVERTRIDLRDLLLNADSGGAFAVKGGDSIYVPKAEEFYIYGEVNTPNKYRIEPGMTVAQALVVGGGVTPRGSRTRIELKRRSPQGGEQTLSPKLDDPVMAGDVIRVKERIF